MTRLSPSDPRCSVGSLVAAIAVLLSPALAAANVYSWTDEKGALHFTNVARQVPEAYRTVAKSDGGASEPEWRADVETVPPAAPPATTERAAPREEPPEHAYVDGFREGMEAATENVRAVGDVLERLVDRADGRKRVPITLPAPRSEEKEPRVVVRVVPRDRGRYIRYGALGPYALGSPWCCSDSFGYGFEYGSFPPHSHFEPTPESLSRARLFFPDGHFSRGGFLFGHGFIVD